MREKRELDGLCYSMKFGLYVFKHMKTARIHKSRACAGAWQMFVLCWYHYSGEPIPWIQASANQ